MDRRRWVRHEVALPVRVGAAEGRVFDMSIGGIRFEVPSIEVAVGHPIEFLVTFNHAAASPLAVRCSGIVVRIEDGHAVPRIAASIDSFTLSSFEPGYAETEH